MLTLDDDHLIRCSTWLLLILKIPFGNSKYALNFSHGCIIWLSWWSHPSGMKSCTPFYRQPIKPMIFTLWSQHLWHTLWWYVKAKSCKENIWILLSLLWSGMNSHPGEALSDLIFGIRYQVIHCTDTWYSIRSQYQLRCDSLLLISSSRLGNMTRWGTHLEFY